MDNSAGYEIPTLHYASASTVGRRASRMPTLLEFLLVVTLLGLLVLIIMPAFAPQVCPARNGMASAAIGPNGGITRAIELYRRHVGRLPTTLADLIQLPPNKLIGDRWQGPYLRDSAELLDPWGRPYRYQQTPNQPTPGYALWSIGVDGINESSPGAQNTGDDIVNWNQQHSSHRPRTKR